MDIDQKLASIELTRSQRTERLQLEVRHDWVDGTIFHEMQQHLSETGSERRFGVQGLGQDCLIVCQTLENLRDLNHVTGLRFNPSLEAIVG